MSTREEYPVGALLGGDAAAGAARRVGLLRALFEWDFSGPGTMPGGMPGEYFVALLEGREVAGIGALPDLGGPSIPVWNTRVRVDSADAAVDRAGSAGGSLVLGPLDASDGGRLAVRVDPSGAAFSVWEARDRAGARVVNEPRAWAMSSLHTPDPASATAFYGELFGWQSEPIAPVTLFRLPGYVGGEPGQPIPRDVVGVMTATNDEPGGP